MQYPMKDVADKVAFITGGSSGIGLGIARAFADAGMRVVIGYRTQKHLDAAMKYLKSAGPRVHAIRVDVTDRRAMQRAAEETTEIFGKIHVLVNNAGVVHSAPLGEMTYADWDWTMAVNLNGVFNGVHAFLPFIQAHGEGGHVITTSSILGLLTLGSGMAAYAVSKFAVVGLMEALRAELASTNIGSSVFCPGMVRSNIAQSSRNRPDDSAVQQDTRTTAREKELRARVDMDPFEAGQLVLRGMCNNDLYILTHAEFEPIIRARNEALIASIPIDLRPTKSRVEIAQAALKHSIYANERHRTP